MTIMRSNVRKLRFALNCIFVASVFAIGVIAQEQPSQSTASATNQNSPQPVSAFDTVTQKDAVIDQKSVALEKVAVVDVRRDEIVRIVTEYNKLRDKHDVDGLDGLYADQLDQYFKNLKNTSKAEVKKADKKYWQSFPQDRFIVSGELAISVNDDGTAKAMLYGRNCRDPKTCTDQLVQINFNAENKITSVRGFIPNG